MAEWWRETWVGDAWDGINETHWYGLQRARYYLVWRPEMPTDAKDWRDDPRPALAKGWAEGDLTPEQLGDMLTDG